MALTEKQRKRVAYMIDGYLSERDEGIFQRQFDQAFAAISSPEELFLFASESHPNQSPSEWRTVLNHRQCDQGTALLIYWRCSPVYCYEIHYRFFVESSENESNWNFARPGYEFLKEIEEQYRSTKYPSQVVKFDPENFKGFSFLKGYSNADIERVPELMRKPSNGEPVMPLSKRDFEWGDVYELLTSD